MTRLDNEIAHGRFLAAHGAGEVWNWESPAGRLRWERRVQMLGAHLRPGMTILEIGCGIGYFTGELARSGAEIVAIDVSPELLEIARANYSSPNVRYEIQNAYALTYPDATFDSVVGSSVLHHLEIQEALREIYRVLKPRGTICFTEPNMLNPQIAIQKNVPWVKQRLGDSPDETAFFRCYSGVCSNKQVIAIFGSIRSIFCIQKRQVADQPRERARQASRERACHLGICGLALYPCDQMNSASTVSQS